MIVLKEKETKHTTLGLDYLFKVNALLARGWQRVSCTVWRKDDTIVLTTDEAFKVVEGENK